MTLRLVGLMSVVLLLSLAAFGFLMQHYQDQVMEEVARTASAVGQATLTTLEGTEQGAVRGEFRRFHRRAVQGELGAIEEELAERMHAEGGGVVVVETFTHEGEAGSVQDFVHEPGSIGYEWIAEQESDPADLACESLRKMMAARGKQGDAETRTGQFFIKVEDLSVEPDPVEGKMVLRIPTFQMEGDTPGPATDMAFFGSQDSFNLAPADEIRMQIGLEDYGELFSKIRGRSIFLFLGVLVVGMVLSTGLATRFTRPIRQLDAGIRRLSDGDLDVQVPVRGEDEIARLGQAFNDMTLKLRASRERSREMVRREKLSSLGRLAAGVAHDVRNPLHSIGLTLQHLRETSRPDDGPRAIEFDRSLDIIRGEIRRLDQMVGNFLRFTRSDRSERQPVDIADLMRETARLVGKEAEWRGISVELDLPEAIPAISADGEAIRSSLLNLVLNSFESMPEGGTLGLRLGIDGGSIVLEVRDTGRGIPEEDQEKVFDFAYTTREGGSGLGLAMVHQTVVEEHGGRVQLDSRPGEGTRVRMALPIRPPERSEHGEPS